MSYWKKKKASTTMTAQADSSQSPPISPNVSPNRILRNLLSGQSPLNNRGQELINSNVIDYGTFSGSISGSRSVIVSSTSYQNQSNINTAPTCTDSGKENVTSSSDVVIPSSSNYNATNKVQVIDMIDDTKEGRMSGDDNAASTSQHSLNSSLFSTPEITNINCDRIMKTYFCRICGIGYADRNDRNKHERQHDPLKCQVCYEIYDDTEKLGQHLLEAHDAISNGSNRLICMLCRKPFCYEYFRTVHRKKHLKHQFYSCRFCGKVFDLPGERQWHEATHKNKNNKCFSGIFNSHELSVI